MNESLKRKAWDLIRPIHAPITRGLRRRLGRNYAGHPEMELPPPYEAIQLDVERHLHHYLHVRPEAIRQILVVGAHEADEISRMHLSYPRASFVCFEPNPSTFARLTRRFGSAPYVTLSNFALNDAPGKAQFFELGMPGNGSLLKPDMETWTAFHHDNNRKVETFEVNLSTLDKETANIPDIDLLWMDVQGAEGQILRGGTEALKRTKAIFLEVALVQSAYQGACLFDEISELLRQYRFSCLGLATDGWNGSGNALFVKNFEKLICKDPTA
jgi:FkbM family methyltransferase